MTLFFSKTLPTLFMAILAKRPITAHYKSTTLFLTGNKWRFKHINNVDKYCEACWLIVSLHYLFYTGLNSQKYKQEFLYVEYFETWCWRTGNIMLLFDNKLFYIIILLHCLTSTITLTCSSLTFSGNITIIGNLVNNIITPWKLVVLTAKKKKIWKVIFLHHSFTTLTQSMCFSKWLCCNIF